MDNQTNAFHSSELFIAFAIFDFHPFNLNKMIIKKAFAIFNPERFQGWTRKRKYFEGWYYKVVNREETRAFAVIPGIAMDAYGNSHAFIQVLDGKKLTSKFHKFNLESFRSASDKFEISISDNHFSRNEMQLNLPDIKGHLHFSGTIPWPNRWYSPGIMGPYAFVPFMECYHGIVSLDHTIKGNIDVNNEILNFDNGRGYTEKDWGQSFPGAYVWLQSNHFSKPGFSFKASVAKIPFLRNWFVGFIAGVWLGDRLIQFTTYNKSVLRRSVIDPDKVELVMENRNYRLEIIARREVSTVLASPIMGLMDGRIEESMNACIEVALSDQKTGSIVFCDTGRNAGLEVAGKIDEIIIV